MLKVVLPVIDEQKCSDLWAQTVKVSNRTLPRGIDHSMMLCAGELQGGKDTCLVKKSHFTIYTKMHFFIHYTKNFCTLLHDEFCE